MGVNNLMAIYVENGLTKLANSKPPQGHFTYWVLRIAEYQPMLNRYDLRLRGGSDPCSLGGGGRSSHILVARPDRLSSSYIESI